jgi:hypothetical protein
MHERSMASVLLSKTEHATCHATRTPRMRRRRIVRRRSGCHSCPSATFSCWSTTTPPISTSLQLQSLFLRRAQAGEGRQPPPSARFPIGMCPVEIQLGRGCSPGRRFATAATVLRPGVQEAGGGGGDGGSRSMKSGDTVVAVLLEPPPLLL